MSASSMYEQMASDFMIQVLQLLFPPRLNQIHGNDTNTITKNFTHAQDKTNTRTARIVILGCRHFSLVTLILYAIVKYLKVYSM